MAKNQTNSELLLVLDRGAGVPAHRQIEAGIRDGIRAGRLTIGTPMPPTRVLARDLGVSRGVVVEAYQQLCAEGYLASRAGGYTHVAAGAEPASVAAAPPPSAPRPRIDFGYGRCDVSHFPRQSWARSIRTALNDAPNERFGYLTGRGVPELHEALAGYLNRVRGTSAKPEDVVICNGFAQGAALLVKVLADSGARRIAVEDPSSDDDIRPAARQSGLEIVGVPIDRGGLRVDALDRLEADAIVLTPSHQYPTGTVLSPEARAAVLRWAGRCDALVIEDDYDAEYRYDRAAIGAIQGLAPDRVAYAGTASKTLTPGLRLGWLVLPRHLVDPVAKAKLAMDRGSAVLDQLAFADFLSRGEFDRHLRRMRPIYRARRDALLAALAAHTPELRPGGIAAGLHLVAWLPPGRSEEAVVAAAARHGVGVHGISQYRLSPGEPGLIFGYATLSERAISEGVALLAAAMASPAPTGRPPG